MCKPSASSGQVYPMLSNVVNSQGQIWFNEGDLKTIPTVRAPDVSKIKFLPGEGTVLRVFGVPRCLIYPNSHDNFQHIQSGME